MLRRSTNSLDDLLRTGKAVVPVPGEHELAVCRDVEDAVRPFDELGLDAQCLLDLGRQTDGPGQVVSNCAVSDPNFHWELFHASRISAPVAGQMPLCFMMCARTVSRVLMR